MRYYGPVLGDFWGIPPISIAGKSCTMASQIDVAMKRSYDFGENLDLSRPAKEVVQALVFSYELMWKIILKFFHVESTSLEQGKMIRFYLLSIRELLEGDEERMLSDEKWSRDSLHRLMRIALELTPQLQVRDHRFLSHHVPLITKTVLALEENPTLRLGKMPHSAYHKDHFQVFPTSATNRCVLFHSRHMSLITDQCRTAIYAAARKISELEIEGDGDFAFLSHLFVFGANFACCLVLIRIFNSKQRLEKKMDEGRRRLQTELNDPLLRKALERKAEQLPPGERERFIAALQEKVTPNQAAVHKKGNTESSYF